jgi:hypothetical protein
MIKPEVDRLPLRRDGLSVLAVRTRQSDLARRLGKERNCRLFFSAAIRVTVTRSARPK